MRRAIIIGLLLAATRSFADMSVSAAVDQARISFGESVVLTINVTGSQNAPAPTLPKIDGLNFAGPSLNQNFSMINGQISQSVSLAYQVTPTRTGEFTIPSLEVNVGGKIYRTEPIKLSVGKPGVQPELQQSLFARVRMNSQQVFLGQTAPLDVILFARANVPVTIVATPVEVLSLPVEGRPADFAGAIGQWNLEVDAKPTEVTVGDPITLTVKLTGTGNVDTVPPVQLKNLDNFKAYDPSAKTTKNELNTTGERVFQQVLVPKDATVTQLPVVQLSYFDPLEKVYRVVTRGPIPIKVKAGTGTHAAIVNGALRARPSERLGQDIVYLKGVAGSLPVLDFAGTSLFWILNLLPVGGLAGALLWKWRHDKLTGDVAYARRSRAARLARKNLSVATGYEEIQRALQEYLGDRLNSPSSGITASVVEERQLPVAVRVIFEACDAARFAGQAQDVTALKQQVEQVIDELENHRH